MRVNMRQALELAGLPEILKHDLYLFCPAISN